MRSQINRLGSSFLSRIKSSRDGKRLVKNFGYLSLLEIVSHLFPLITLPYLGRVIGVKGFGLLAIGTSVIAYVNSITNYGFEYSAVRDVARCRDDSNAVSRSVSLTYCCKFLLMGVSLIILAICCQIIPFMGRHSTIIWCSFILVFGNVLNTDWVFQAYEDMQYITIRNIVAKSIATALIFVVIRTPDDYFWQPILEAIGVIIPSILGLIVLYHRYSIRLILPTINQILFELKKGFSLFVSIFLPTIYTNLNVLILGSSQGTAATGIYNGASRFTGLAFSVFKLISRTVYPLFSRRLDKHTLYVRVSLLLSICISLVLFLFARPLVLLLLGPEFEETIKVLRIVAFTPIAMSLMNSYGFNYLVLQQGEKTMSRIIVFVTIIGLILGILGATMYSYIGVAIASIITQFLRAGLVTYYARRIK